jgi:hypothetical protein
MRAWRPLPLLGRTVQPAGGGKPRQSAAAALALSSVTNVIWVVCPGAGRPSMLESATPGTTKKRVLPVVAGLPPVGEKMLKA